MRNEYPTVTLAIQIFNKIKGFIHIAIFNPSSLTFELHRTIIKKARGEGMRIECIWLHLQMHVIVHVIDYI